MTNTLLRLRKKIPEQTGEILRTVFEAAGNLKIQTFVVGAAARDLIFEYVYDAGIKRATEDIDFGVAVGSWSEYELLKKSLTETKKFRDDQNGTQQIWWTGKPNKVKIDLVPYGGLESPPGEIAFPPDRDFVMSTIGFAEAYKDSWLLELSADLTIRIASLPGLALLKFIAYSDRPAERRRDVQDIWFISRNYMQAVNEEDRLYQANATDVDLLTDDFNYETCGARLLGRDLAPLINRESLAIIGKILAEDGGLQKIADVIYGGGLSDESKYENILETLRELRRGIAERISI